MIDLKLGQIKGDIQITDTVCQRGNVFRHMRVPVAYLDVMTLDAKFILVTTVHVPYTHRRQGIGRELIKAIQTFNKPILLSADPTVDINHQVSMEVLHDFYTSLGFSLMEDDRTYQWKYR